MKRGGLKVKTSSARENKGMHWLPPTPSISTGESCFPLPQGYFSYFVCLPIPLSCYLLDSCQNFRPKIRDGSKWDIFKDFKFIFNARKNVKSEPDPYSFFDRTNQSKFILSIVPW